MSAQTQAPNGSHDSSTDNKHVDFQGVIDVSEFDLMERHMRPTIDEFKIVINSAGWHIRVVNPQNVVSFDVRISADQWESYNPIQQGVIGISRKGLREMMDFVDATDGDAHITVDPETRYIRMSDGDRLYIEQALIDPDAIRQRPNGVDMGDSVVAPMHNDTVWAFKKWIRGLEDKTYRGKRIRIRVDEKVVSFETQSDEDRAFMFDRNSGDEIEHPFNDGVVDDYHSDPVVDSEYSCEYLYQLFKKPKKAQLTECPYVFSFMGTDVIKDVNSHTLNDVDRPLQIHQAADDGSKIEYRQAPMMKR